MIMIKLMVVVMGDVTPLWVYSTWDKEECRRCHLGLMEMGLYYISF